jgi:hypothetical protein
MAYYLKLIILLALALLGNAFMTPHLRSRSGMMNAAKAAANNEEKKVVGSMM